MHACIHASDRFNYLSKYSRVATDWFAGHDGLDWCLGDSRHARSSLRNRVRQHTPRLFPAPTLARAPPRCPLHAGRAALRRLLCLETQQWPRYDGPQQRHRVGRPAPRRQPFSQMTLKATPPHRGARALVQPPPVRRQRPRRRPPPQEPCRRGRAPRRRQLPPRAKSDSCHWAPHQAMMSCRLPVRRWAMRAKRPMTKPRRRRRVRRSAGAHAGAVGGQQRPAAAAALRRRGAGKSLSDTSGALGQRGAAAVAAAAADAGAGQEHGLRRRSGSKGPPRHAHLGSGSGARRRPGRGAQPRHAHKGAGTPPLAPCGAAAGAGRPQVRRAATHVGRQPPRPAATGGWLLQVTACRSAPGGAPRRRGRRWRARTRNAACSSQASASAAPRNRRIWRPPWCERAGAARQWWS